MSPEHTPNGRAVFVYCIKWNQICFIIDYAAYEKSAQRQLNYSLCAKRMKWKSSDKDE